MGAALYFTPAHYFDNVWGLLIAVALASLLYFTALFAVRGIDRQDLALLLNQEPEEKEFL
jgi:hypothetical protein